MSLQDRENLILGDVPRPSVRFPHAVRAGSLLFLGQQLGLSPTTGRPVTGYADLPAPVAEELSSGRFAWDSWAGPVRAQCWQMLKHHQQVLERAGADLGDLLRVNMWMVDFSQLPVLMPVRSAPFRPHTPPPITNIGAREFGVPSALIQSSAIAGISRDGVMREELRTSEISQDVGDYLIATRFGNHMFAAGMIAARNDTRTSISSPEELEDEASDNLIAIIGKGGRGIRDVHGSVAAQTAFILRDIRAFLSANSLETRSVAKMTVYLKNWRDLPTFWHVFSVIWPEPQLPPVTIVGCTELGSPGFELEIEISAYTPEDSEDEIELVEPQSAIFDETASAARAGEFVYLGAQAGLLSGGGLAYRIPEVSAIDSAVVRIITDSAAGTSRYQAIVAQLLAALDNADRTLRAFGRGLADLVHINVFLRDSAVTPVIESLLGDRLPEPTPALSIVEVPWLPVREAEVMIDGVAFVP